MLANQTYSSNSIKRKQCKYGSECRSLLRDLQYGENNFCKHDDAIHLNNFLHPQFKPKSKPKKNCKYGDKCRHYVGFLLNDCNRTDIEHNNNYKHKHTKETDYNLIRHFILTNNKKKVIKMLSDQKFDISYCPPIENNRPSLS